MADARIRGVSPLNAAVSFDEVFGLANTPTINRHAQPRLGAVIRILELIRQGRIRNTPARYESRFHTLRHTEMFLLERGTVRLRDGVNDADRQQLLAQLHAMCSISLQFNGFDRCSRVAHVERVIAGGAWGRYFDGVCVLPPDIVEALTTDIALESTMPIEPAIAGEPAIRPEPVAERYPLRDRTDTPPAVRPFDRRRDMADPELTRIKRQKRNLAHKELIGKMDAWLRRLGASPKENDHIDLFAKIPDDGSFIFEMKSGGESILEQIRKGLSQLYEYRYRYRPMINDEDISLCLVLPGPPVSIPWAEDYLCKDREINICWFEGGDRLKWSELCAEGMEALALRE